MALQAKRAQAKRDAELLAAQESTKLTIADGSNGSKTEVNSTVFSLNESVGGVKVVVKKDGKKKEKSFPEIRAFRGIIVHLYSY
jgi:hypothetical protein